MNLWHLIQSKTCQAMGPVGAPAPGLTNVAWYLNCQLCKLWVAAFSKAGEFLWRAVSLGYPVKSATGCKRAAGNPIHQKLRLSWLCKQTWPDLRCGRQTRWDSAGAFLPLQCRSISQWYINKYSILCSVYKIRSIWEFETSRKHQFSCGRFISHPQTQTVRVGPSLPSRLQK